MLITDPMDGQSYNRYSYVNNNPTNLTDPTGFRLERPATTIMGGGDWQILGDPEDFFNGRTSYANWKKSTGTAANRKTPSGESPAGNVSSGSANTTTAEPEFVARHPATSEIHFLAADKWDRWSEHFAERKQETGNFIYGNLSQWTGLVADNLDGIVMVAGSIRGVKGGAGKLGVPEAGFVPNAKVAGPYSRPSGAGPTAEQKAAVQGKPCAECGALSKNQVADHKVPLVVQHYRDGKVNVDQQRRVDAVQPHCPSCSAQQGGYLSGFSRAMKQLFGF